MRRERAEASSLDRLRGVLHKSFDAEDTPSRLSAKEEEQEGVQRGVGSTVNRPGCIPDVGRGRQRNVGESCHGSQSDRRMQILLQAMAEVLDEEAQQRAARDGERVRQEGYRA